MQTTESVDPRPTLKLTTDAFVFADDSRLHRFLTGAARPEELEAVEAIGDEPFELTTDDMLAQIADFHAQRQSRREVSRVLKSIRVMLAAVGHTH